MPKQTFQFDKNSFETTASDQNFSDVEFWLSKSPEERFLAVEFLRQSIFGYDPITERLQRFFETAEFKTS